MGWPSRRWAGVRATVCAVALGLLGACGQATPAELACAERPGELPLLRCGFGACATFVPACDAEGRPTVCRAPEPTETEVTDGFDNNCDGAVDETAFCPVGSRKSCYGGSRGTRGRGICSDGTQGCSAGRWGACVGERFPELELPDGLDNDCDGEIDEGLPCATAGAQQSCFAGPATSKSEGACQVGTQTCALTREGLLRWGACLGQVTPNPERCDGVSADGIDNDCDGLTDEDCSCIEGSPCYHGPVGAGGRGTCRVGVASCWADGAWRACVGEVYPSEELCDGLDNDCNGVTDDLYVGQVDPAPSCDVPGRVGICKEGAIR